MFFLVKYAKQLEEGSFRGRSVDFAWMLVAGAAAIAAAAPLARGRVQFLGSSLAFMMVYVWSRRHRRVRMSFLGVATFEAPYLPWVLLAFSALLRPGGGGAGGGSGVAVDLLGLAVGHCYYFFEDVYPRLTDGRRPLGTPRVLTALFGGGGAGGRPAGALGPAAPRRWRSRAAGGEWTESPLPPLRVRGRPCNLSPPTFDENARSEERRKKKEKERGEETGEGKRKWRLFAPIRSLSRLGGGIDRSPLPSLSLSLSLSRRLLSRADSPPSRSRSQRC